MLIFYLSTLETESQRLKLTDIYEKYKPLMLSCAINILKNKEAAEDAVHDSFMAIIRHKEKYLSENCPNLGPSIVIIVKNKCYDMLRKAENKVESIEDYSETLISNDMPIDKKLSIDETYNHLRSCISKLDGASRSILEMRYVLGLSHKEIAVQLDISPGYINKKITRAKAKIRELIKKDGYHNG